MPRLSRGVATASSHLSAAVSARGEQLGPLLMSVRPSKLACTLYVHTLGPLWFCRLTASMAISLYTQRNGVSRGSHDGPGAPHLGVTGRSEPCIPSAFVRPVDISLSSKNAFIKTRAMKS